MKRILILPLFLLVFFHCHGQKFIPMGTGLKCQGIIFKTFTDTINNRFYAGGYFNAIENIDASGIAMWDGTSWSSLGSGIEGAVFDIEIFNNELYVVGNFTSAGGIVVGNMARWDGSQWHSVINSGTAAQINEIEAFNGKLYISGSFQYVDGVGANRAAVWDGISWAPLGTGFDLAPIDISKTSDRIYFSGSFNNFDTLTAYKLAWIDTQGNYGGLSILAAAHFNYINSINVRNDTLYLSTDQNLYWWNGTQFFNLIVNPRRVERSFYFNDTTYIIYSDYQNYKTYVSKLHTGNVLPPTLTSNLEDPTQNYLLRYYSASVSDTGFFIGGNFSSVNGKPSASLLFYGNQQINHFGKCALPVYASQDQYAMANTLFADTGTGLIYIGGNFLFSDHLFTSNISAWNGNNWLKLGEGLSGLVNSITQYNGEIYAGGKFLSSGSTTLNNLAKWDGTNWLPIGNGTNGEIKKLLVHNNELYIGGDFTLIDTFPISFCAKFNGTQFVSVGDSAPLLHPVYDMEFYKGVLYASLKEYSWSRLKGTKWISPGITAPTIMGLEKHNDTLFVGSSGVVFYLADSVTGSIYPANNTPNKLSPLIINNRLFGTCDYYLLCRNGYSFDHYVNQFAAKTSIDISPTQSIVGGYFPYTINAFGKKYLNSIGILEFIPPAATIRASDDTICEYKHITFYPETEDLFLRYNWSFPGGSPVAATNEICYIQYLFQGKYPVTLTLTNEVGTLVIQLSDSIVVNNCVTEIPTIEVKESTLVFPNPFTDILQIKSRLRGECLYCIRDICGRLVYMKRENENEITTINMGYLSPGMYILEISGEGFRHSQKIIKQ